MSSDATKQAAAFLGGQGLSLEDADKLWRELKRANQLTLARRVLVWMRRDNTLIDGYPGAGDLRNKLAQQEAELTSKDQELSAASRHDQAIAILEDTFELWEPSLDGDGETLGIAGGIYKRRWQDLGQLRDLKIAASCYTRGAKGPMGDDAYPHINAAFLEELLASLGDDEPERKARARALRESILEKLPVLPGNWWNVATRAEALVGLGRYDEATAVLDSGEKNHAPWQLHATANQLATLAHLQQDHPLEDPEVRRFFDTLLPGATNAVRSAHAGKVGLALSGGGLRASFYHLGVFARLAELNVLRHVDVLSCVSGGSIVGACYWLVLRQRLMQETPLVHQDYIDLVQSLIEHFERAVATDLRAAGKTGKFRAIWNILRGKKGAIDPSRIATALDEHFYGPLVGGRDTEMGDLPFQPSDHDAVLTKEDEFNPEKHNWLRADKVPVFVLNATTLNTGHAWQFTPKWMGESPWAVHEAADSVPRLEWAWYNPKWRIRLAEAVSASACVPGVFQPVAAPKGHEKSDVYLVDGGVHDNQGTVSLLALGCNVMLVSDAAGQLGYEDKPTAGGLLGYANRAMSTLQARIRLTNYGDLVARKSSGLLKGLMFLHMKAGLEADTIPLEFSQRSVDSSRRSLTPSGIRQEFQAALAGLRTDLDAFAPNEARGLMACGYQMTTHAFERDLKGHTELWDGPLTASWPFDAIRDEITSTEPTTPQRDDLLRQLEAGSKISL